jgi:hypothetical protein
MEKLRDAQRDLKYLLDRGYRRSTALNFVCGHYRLAKKSRNRLVRTAFSDEEIRDHKSRLVPMKEIRGEKIAVDGYNVLIGAECVWGRGRVIASQDGFHRDALGVFGRHKGSKYTKKAIDRTLLTLQKHNPSEVVFLFDAQVSKSGELARHVRKRMAELGITGDARTSRTVDHDLKAMNAITATSDTGIIEKVDRAIDIVGAL